MASTAPNPYLDSPAITDIFDVVAAEQHHLPPSVFASVVWLLIALGAVFLIYRLARRCWPRVVAMANQPTRLRFFSGDGPPGILLAFVVGFAVCWLWQRSVENRFGVSVLGDGYAILIDHRSGETWKTYRHRNEWDKCRRE